MLRTLERQKGAENKYAEADFKNPCSYKMKSVYVYGHDNKYLNHQTKDFIITDNFNIYPQLLSKTFSKFGLLLTYLAL